MESGESTATSTESGRTWTEGDPALIARFFIEDPSFLQAVAVNEIVAHVVIGGAWLAAWIVGKRKNR